MSRSKAQEFASKRNWAIGTFGGMRSNLRRLKTIATEEEKEKLDKLIEEVDSLQLMWNNNYDKAKRKVLNKI